MQSTGTTTPHSAQVAAEPVICCAVYQEAVELVGRRWTGAIISVLLERPMRFCEISTAVPELSDRLLAARLKELEQRGLIDRSPCPTRQSSQVYSLTEMGRELTPALDAIQDWARRWLSQPSD